MLKKLFKNEKGLTLIELLAVIVILGIIAAIAVPSIGGIIEKTRQDAQKAEAIQIISSAKMHMASNAFTGTGAETRTLTTAQLIQYLDNVKDVTSSTDDAPDFTVTVSKAAGATQYTYRLNNHDYEANLPADMSEDPAATGLTEAELGIE